MNETYDTGDVKKTCDYKTLFFDITIYARAQIYENLRRPPINQNRLDAIERQNNNARKREIHTTWSVPFSTYYSRDLFIPMNYTLHPKTYFCSTLCHRVIFLFLMFNVSPENKRQGFFFRITAHYSHSARM